MIRVSLVGPECSGKTTLARSLAEHYSAPWTPEYARVYAEKVDRPLTRDDVEPIAKGQLELIEGEIGHPGELVIHDTDLLSTLVYAEYYYGGAPEWLTREVSSRSADLYLLLSPLTMESDGVRDSGADREGISELFVEKLVAQELNWYAIGQRPYESALQLIDDLLRSRRRSHS